MEREVTPPRPYTRGRECPRYGQKQMQPWPGPACVLCSEVAHPFTKYKESGMSRVNKLSKLFRRSAPYRTRKWAKLAASSALHRDPWISEDLKNNPYFWVS